MMIGGDDDAIGGVGTGRSRAVDPTASTEPTLAAEGAEAADAASGAAATSAVDGTQAVDSGSQDLDIAAALDAGTLDAQGALDALIDQTVAAQLPADAAPETVAQLRADVAAMLANDPTLQGLLS